jgi:hypothetical protein
MRPLKTMVNFSRVGQGDMTEQKDPNGVDQHAPGAKLDAGKTRPGLVLSGFSKALMAVSEVGTYGANKYTDFGWMFVVDGEKRYMDAMYRHLMAFHSGELHDKESHLMHLAHAAWNALAILELELQE